MIRHVLLVLAAWSFGGLAAAAQPVYTSFFSDVAIKGYDPVAYFTQGQAVEGSNAHKLRWQDAEWHFANAEHRQLFADNPEKYAPQYGGYCAYAIAAKDDLVRVDPRAWSIVDGKLYLNYSQTIKADWDDHRGRYIPQGDRNWRKKLE